MSPQIRSLRYRGRKPTTWVTNLKNLRLLGTGRCRLGLPLAASAQITVSATIVTACTFGSATVTLNGARSPPARRDRYVEHR